MDALYERTTFDCSRIITRRYSTSFSLGIYTLHAQYRDAIYAIYGFVRCADEIVDANHPFEKDRLLAKFKKETFSAIKDQVSLNPVLHAFQMIVNKFRIDHLLIEAFFKSMSMDLNKLSYSTHSYGRYIYGSAEAVGLMCLKVFCNGDEAQYEKLKDPARRLGAAFQKVNFLRDISDDYHLRGRVYFPDLSLSDFTEESKLAIIDDIQEDFDEAYKGIINLPRGARLGVYLAYVYYLQLFKQLKNCPISRLLKQRERIPNARKYFLLIKTYLLHRLNYY